MNGRIGLFCEDYPSLRERHLSKIEFEFPSWLGTLNKSDHEFKLAPKYGGWTIALRNLDDPSKYLSSEFAAILVDEITRNSREIFDFLNMRRRWPGIPDCKFLCASNPGGIGHGWVKKLWISRNFEGENFDPREFKFIPAKAIDNVHLGEAYERQLGQLPEKLRKAYRDGDWDVFAGQYFTEWSRERNVVESFTIPAGWSRIRCLDYGYEAPSACYWLAINYDGHVYAYRELYESGLTYAQLARKIAAFTPKDENIEYTVADTSMFAKTLDTGEDGDSIMAQNGVEITAANKERIAGWNLMREYLREGRLKFFSTCTKAIETIPALVHDANKIEDVAKGSDDHAADSLRYGLQSLPPIPVRQKDIIINPYENDKDSPWHQAEESANPYRYR